MNKFHFFIKRKHFLNNKQKYIATILKYIYKTVIDKLLVNYSLLVSNVSERILH